MAVLIKRPGLPLSADAGLGLRLLQFRHNHNNNRPYTTCRNSCLEPLCLLSYRSEASFSTIITAGKIPVTTKSLGKRGQQRSAKLLQQTRALSSHSSRPLASPRNSSRASCSTRRTTGTTSRTGSKFLDQHPGQLSVMSAMGRRSMNIDKVNPNVKAAEYAVRGELAVRAEKYRQQLAKNDSESKRPPTPGSNGSGSGDEQEQKQKQKQPELPFDSVVSANIGNPQQLDQQPITFFRQVLSLLENPLLLEKEAVLREGLGYGQDVIERARWLLDEAKNVGAYSQSQGVLGVRKSVARFIQERDGFKSNPDDIYLTAGASSGVNTLMNIIISGPEAGVLVPIPQYPLYTATLSVLNGRCVPYYLDEESNWSTNLESIRSALADARKKDKTDVRAIVVINPGNPTGGTLSADDIKGILTLAAEEGLVVLADEVYQTNIFEGSFVSFKRALRELQSDDSSNKYAHVELASLHSVSKGMVGECGHRGGYMELVGFEAAVLEQIYKFVSISLCPPVIGQCLVELMVNPPREGDPSYAAYKAEYDGIAAGLRKRAYALFDAFQSLQGVSCQRPQGSMYLYPRLELPQRALDAAARENRSPDEFYVSRLLDRTGICVVPGSGFGQKEGTLHFRTTFLAPGTEWVGRIRDFHKEFMDEFS